MNEQNTQKSISFEGLLGRSLGRGWKESEVFEYLTKNEKLLQNDPDFQNKWVIKLTHNQKLDTIERHHQNRTDYIFLKEKLSEYVPDAYFIRGYNPEGVETNVIVQKRIQGRPLSRYARAEIEGNQALTSELAKFFARVVEMWHADGRIPDVYGHEKGFPKMFDHWHPEFAPNLVIEESTNKVFLVDISCGEEYFSQKSPYLFRLSNRLLVRRMREFAEKHGTE